MKVLPGDIWNYINESQVESYQVISVTPDNLYCAVVNIATTYKYDNYPVSYFKTYGTYWKLIKRYPQHTKLGKVLYK